MKQQDEQYKLVYDYVFSIREDILKRDEVLAQVYDSPNTFKEAMVDLLDWLKHDFTVRTAKVTDNVLHIAYRNGWFWVIEEIKKAILNNTTIEKEIIGELTRRPKQNLDKRQAKTI